jgi:hypothetical protein
LRLRLRLCTAIGHDASEVTTATLRLRFGLCAAIGHNASEVTAAALRLRLGQRDSGDIRDEKGEENGDEDLYVLVGMGE